MKCASSPVSLTLASAHTMRPSLMSHRSHCGKQRAIILHFSKHRDGVRRSWGSIPKDHQALERAVSTEGR